MKLAGGGGELGHKAWKTHSSRKKMVLGDDVGLGEISLLSSCALVSQFSYWAYPKTNIGRWMEKHKEVFPKEKYWSMDGKSLGAFVKLYSDPLCSSSWVVFFLIS